MKNKEERKPKVRGAKGRMAGRIIAALMVGFMLVGSCSTLIYYIVK